MAAQIVTKSNYQRERESILKTPCSCVRCAGCMGQGLRWFPYPEQWPEDDLETCSECHGSGIAEQCTRCNDLDELEEVFHGEQFI